MGAEEFTSVIDQDFNEETRTPEEIYERIQEIDKEHTNTNPQGKDYDEGTNMIDIELNALEDTTLRAYDGDVQTERRSTLFANFFGTKTIFLRRHITETLKDTKSPLEIQNVLNSKSLDELAKIHCPDNLDVINAKIAKIHQAQTNNIVRAAQTQK